MKEYIKRILTELNIEGEEEKSELFNIYYNEVVEKNKVMNLTAITEMKEFANKHFFDSLYALQFLDKDAKVVDIGSGAGFPALPLKIACPTLDITMVDSLNKRVLFLTETIKKLGLNKCRALHYRAEDFANMQIEREHYDVCIARAVAHLSTLCEYCLPLLKIGGKFVAYKGNIDEELPESLNAIKILGGELEKVKVYDLPDNMGTHTLVIIKKINSTPKKFPRGKNLPKTQPIR